MNTAAIVNDAFPGAADPQEPAPQPTNRLQRWRLVLGQPAEASCGGVGGPGGSLEEMDKALAALYDEDSKLSRRGGRGNSSPGVARWLGDIRKYFPSQVVQVMQRDAMERLNLRELMLQPEMLEHVQPDVHMVADLISLGSVIPQSTKETARMVVRKVVDDLMRRLEEPMRSAVSGALDRSQRNRRPQREVILCIDQSGSMANSVVYSSIFGAVMASLPAVATRLVVFDTAVVDLTDKLSDPVDVLFGVQLGGGTDINRAVGYCQGLISEPRNAIVVLISDLYEGGVESGLLRRASELVESGVQFITLLALSDEGAPAYDAQLAAKLAALGVPSFACTPDAFPQLMAAAIRRDDVAAWAAGQGFKTSK
jgi:Mg-chelatase subunit ChlD